MASAVPETEIYEAEITGPEDDDDANAASVRTPFSQAASRSKWLLARLGEVLGVFKSATADATTDVVSTAAAHGFSTNDPVRFMTVGGALPGGLSAGVIYYVRDVTPTTFKVAASAGGAAIDLTSAGSPDIYAWSVPDAAAAMFSPASGVLPAGSLRSQITYLRDNKISLAEMTLSTLDSGWNAGLPPSVPVTAVADSATFVNVGTGVTVSNVVAGQKILVFGRARVTMTGGSGDLKLGNSTASISVDGSTVQIDGTPSGRDFNLWGMHTVAADAASLTFYMMYKHSSGGAITSLNVMSLQVVRLG